MYGKYLGSFNLAVYKYFLKLSSFLSRLLNDVRSFLNKLNAEFLDVDYCITAQGSIRHGVCTIWKLYVYGQGCFLLGYELPFSGKLLSRLAFLSDTPSCFFIIQRTLPIPFHWQSWAACSNKTNVFLPKRQPAFGKVNSGSEWIQCLSLEVWKDFQLTAFLLSKAFWLHSYI